MDYWQRERAGAATGFVAALLFAIGVLLPGPFPAPGAPAGEIRAFLVDARAALIAQTFFFGVAGMLALWFLGSLRSGLHRAEGGAGRLAAVAFGAGVAVIMFAGVAVLLITGPAHLFAGELTPELTAAFFRLGQLSLVLAAFPAIALVGSATLVIRRTRLLPTPALVLGIVAMSGNAVGALALLAVSGPFAPGGMVAFYVPFATTLVWTAYVSAGLMSKLGHPVAPKVARRRIGDAATPHPAMLAEHRRRTDTEE